MRSSNSSRCLSVPTSEIWRSNSDSARCSIARRLTGSDNKILIWVCEIFAGPSSSLSVFSRSRKISKSRSSAVCLLCSFIFTIFPAFVVVSVISAIPAFCIRVRSFEDLRNVTPSLSQSTKSDMFVNAIARYSSMISSTERPSREATDSLSSSKYCCTVGDFMILLKFRSTSCVWLPPDFCGVQYPPSFNATNLLKCLT